MCPHLTSTSTTGTSPTPMCFITYLSLSLKHDKLVLVTTRPVCSFHYELWDWETLRIRSRIFLFVRQIFVLFQRGSVCAPRVHLLCSYSPSTGQMCASFSMLFLLLSLPEFLLWTNKFEFSSGLFCAVCYWEELWHWDRCPFGYHCHVLLFFFSCENWLIRRKGRRGRKKRTFRVKW